MNYRIIYNIISKKLEFNILILLTVNSKFMEFSLPSFFPNNLWA